MAGASRGGRPWGPIRAESGEAAALARFLRAQVDKSGKTLAVLAMEINSSKSRVSAYLAGKVPDKAFVSALVGATTPREPQLQDRRLAEALRLLHAAQHPSAAAAPPLDPPSSELDRARLQQIEVSDQLIRALEQQNRLHEAAGNSTKLVMVLLSVIGRLERRITELTSEAEQLRTAQGDPAALKTTQQQLTRAQEQERRAQRELARAQEKQRQAETLAAQVQARLDQLTDELDRLRAATPDGEAADSSPTTFPRRTAADADPVGDDIDKALDRAVEVNDHDDDVLQHIADDLAPDDGATAVVQDKARNNPTTSPSPRNNPVKAINNLLRRSLNKRETKAISLGEAGDAAGAAAAYAELLPDFEHRQGPEHPDTLRTRHNLAHWQGEAGDAAGAATAFAELLPDMQRVLGPEHPDTLRTRRSLAHFRGEAGDAAGAATAFAELLPDMQRVLGPQDPSTLSTRRSLAHWQGEAGDAVDAVQALTELLSEMERALGLRHPDTLRTRGSLGYWLGRRPE